MTYTKPQNYINYKIESLTGREDSFESEYYDMIRSAFLEYSFQARIGNMDGVSKCFRLLGSPGDNFLADEFSFNALTNAPLSHGVSWVPVKIDEGGLIPSDLERVLSEWDERVHGRRPHVLYTVP